MTLSGGTINSTVSGETLENDGNTISGNGLIGSTTNSNLTLNIVSGSIAATGGTLTIDAGSNMITNSGTLEATSGTLVLDSNVANTNGTIEATGAGSLVERIMSRSPAEH